MATQHPRSNTSDSQPGWRYVFLNHELPAWLMEAYKKIGIFVFGGAVSQLTTDIAKYSVGRLRPHFLTVNTEFYIVFQKHCHLTCNSRHFINKKAMKFLYKINSIVLNEKIDFLDKRRPQVCIQKNSLINNIREISYRM